jgi:hypothetical protein
MRDLAGMTNCDTAYEDKFIITSGAARSLLQDFVGKWTNLFYYELTNILEDKKD